MNGLSPIFDGVGSQAGDHGRTEVHELTRIVDRCGCNEKHLVSWGPTVFDSDALTADIVVIRLICGIAVGKLIVKCDFKEVQARSVLVFEDGGGACEGT
jgi:hypothetical protein